MERWPGLHRIWIMYQESLRLFTLTWKDPGVHVSSEGLIEVKGKSYEALKVWFGDGVGFTPKDVYYLYLDPQSKLLEILVYSVSFIDKSESPGLNSAKVYSDWKEVQGLKMPGKMENFAWTDGEMGESSGHLRILSEYKFLKEVAGDKLAK